MADRSLPSDPLLSRVACATDPDHPPVGSKASNHAVAGAQFMRRFGRAPLAPSDPRALINDHIFDRMIDPDWTGLERAAVDKSTAKQAAIELAPTLCAPETLGVIPMREIVSSEQLFDALMPFIGMSAIAKPTHASGSVVRLDSLKTPDQLDTLFSLAIRDYADVLCEMQYHGLPRQIIVETLVPSVADGPPDDYKFHCVDGVPIVCQVDHARFRKPWSRLLRLPDFAPFDPDDGLTPPESYRLPAPERIDAMIAAAAALSRPFRFVRVDLYDGLDGIYFGEWTFSPAASLGIAPSAAGDHELNDTHLAYSAAMMIALRG